MTGHYDCVASMCMPFAVPDAIHNTIKSIKCCIGVALGKARGSIDKRSSKDHPD